MDTSKYLETFTYVNLSNSDRRALEMPAELVEYIEHLNRYFKYVFPQDRLDLVYKVDRIDPHDTKYSYILFYLIIDDSAIHTYEMLDLAKVQDEMEGMSQSALSSDFGILNEWVHFEDIKDDFYVVVQVDMEL